MHCQGLLGKLGSKGSVIYRTDIHGAVDRYPWGCGQRDSDVRGLPVCWPDENRHSLLWSPGVWFSGCRMTISSLYIARLDCL